MPVEDRDIVALMSSSGLVLAATVLESGSKLVERIIIVRTLSPDAWGEVSIGLVILLMATTFSAIGLGQGVPRYMSRFDDEADTRGTWLTGLLVAGGLGVAVAAFLIFNATWIAGLLFESPDSPRLLVLFVLCIPLSLGLKIAKSGIRGMENTVYKVLLQLLYPVVRIGLLVALLAAGYGIFAPGLAYFAALLLFVLVGHYLLHRLIPLVGPSRTRVVELLRFSAPLMLSAFVMVLLTRTDTLMVGYFSTSEQVGLYSAAYPLANAMLMTLSAVGYLYLPMASRYDAEGDHDKVTEIYELTTKWAIIMTFPLFMVYVLFPGDFLSLLYGGTYRQAATAFVLLSLAALSSLVFGRCQETLSALGRTGWILATNVGVFVLNVAMNVVLIPLYGIEGASVASMVSFLLLNGSLWAILRLQFGISPFSGHTLRTLGVLMLVVLPAGAVVSRAVPLTLWTLVPIGAVGGVATIVAVALAGGFQAEDRVVLESFENYVGIRVPVVRRYMPEPEPATGD